MGHDLDEEKAEADISNVSPAAKEAVISSSSSSDETDKEKSDEFLSKLAGLPEKYRAEILRQYDIPDARANLFFVFRYAGFYEILLMAIGTVTCVAAGTYSSI
jgi:hypothetical protein